MASVPTAPATMPRVIAVSRLMGGAETSVHPQP